MKALRQDCLRLKMDNEVLQVCKKIPPSPLRLLNTERGASLPFLLKFYVAGFHFSVSACLVDERIH